MKDRAPRSNRWKDEQKPGHVSLTTLIGRTWSNEREGHRHEDDKARRLGEPT